MVTCVTAAGTVQSCSAPVELNVSVPVQTPETHAPGDGHDVLLHATMLLSCPASTPLSVPELLPLLEPLLDPELLPLLDPELLPLLDPELEPLDPELLPLLDPELLPLLDPELEPLLDPELPPLLDPELPPSAMTTTSAAPPSSERSTGSWIPAMAAHPTEQTTTSAGVHHPVRITMWPPTESQRRSAL